MGGGEVRAAGDEVNYFFCQGDEPTPRNAWSNRRPKKTLDEQTLLSLSSKKNLSSLAKLSQELDPTASLKDRLNVILKVAGNSTSMTSLPGLNSSGPVAATSGGSRSQVEWENAASSSAYTDTRLQALRLAFFNF